MPVAHDTPLQPVPGTPSFALTPGDVVGKPVVPAASVGVDVVPADVVAGLVVVDDVVAGGVDVVALDVTGTDVDGVLVDGTLVDGALVVAGALTVDGELELADDELESSACAVVGAMLSAAIATSM